jgi:Zn-dependent protease with chaperone function
MADAATHTGPAVYFDGITAARHVVTVVCMPSGLDIRGTDGRVIAHWLYGRLAHLNAPAHLFRIGLRGSDRLERLELEDRNLAHAIDLACPTIDRTDAGARAQRRRAVILSLAAALSLLLVAFYGIPQIADQLSRLVPPQIEQKLGRAADARVRLTLDKGPKGQPFECGTGPGEAEGKIVFDKLMTQLAKGSGLAMAIRPAVVRREEANAFALAGGHIYVLRGLIENAKDVDEVAAVIAHELGHVANRDGMRSVLQSAGLSLVFGMLLGDFVGGAAVVVAAQLLLKASYSRRQETAADDFSVRTLQELKANPRALAIFLDRVARTPKGWSIFLAHPSVLERVARINAMALPETDRKPLLTDAEWQALRRICAGHR